ncbi:class I SAM-dependent methyltransferase [Brachybacterium sp. DNPG3]
MPADPRPARTVADVDTAVAADTEATDTEAAQRRMTSYWDRYAAEYDAHQRFRLGLDGEAETWARVWSAALPAAPARVLDVGTGTGNVALQLAALGHEVTGIDLSEGMLAQARAKAADRGAPRASVGPMASDEPAASDGPVASDGAPAPVFARGDAVAPPFAPGSFDAIVSRYLLWTLRDAPAALERWFALLRPGGVLVAVDSPWYEDAPALPRRTAREADFADAYDEDAFGRLPFGRAGVERIRAALAEAGFEDVRADPLPEILALDHAHGVAPGHTPAMQHRFSARRPDAPALRRPDRM